MQSKYVMDKKHEQIILLNNKYHNLDWNVVCSATISKIHWQHGDTLLHVAAYNNDIYIISNS